MLHLHLITLGSLKETYWREATLEYTKRLKPWASITIHEIKEEPFSEKNNPELIKKKEAEKIKTELKKIPDSYIIALDEHGKQFSSQALASELSKITMHESSTLVFIIGGPQGLDETIVKNARLTWSLSAATLPHQMVRVVLLEALYRAMMIQNNRPYHY